MKDHHRMVDEKCHRLNRI